MSIYITQFLVGAIWITSTAHTMEANLNQQSLDMGIPEHNRHRYTTKDFTFLGIFLLLWGSISICCVLWYAAHIHLSHFFSLKLSNRLLRVSRTARQTLAIVADGVIEEGLACGDAKSRLQSLENAAPSKTLKDWLRELPAVHSHLVEYHTQSLIW